MAFGSFILFQSPLNKVCFTMIKLLFIQMESGEFGDSHLGVFVVKQKGSCSYSWVDLYRYPFCKVIGHLRACQLQKQALLVDVD